MKRTRELPLTHAARLQHVHRPADAVPLTERVPAVGLQLLDVLVRASGGGSRPPPFPRIADAVPRELLPRAMDGVAAAEICVGEVERRSRDAAGHDEDRQREREALHLRTGAGWRVRKSQQVKQYALHPRRCVPAGALSGCAWFGHFERCAVCWFAIGYLSARREPRGYEAAVERRVTTGGCASARRAPAA